MTAKWNECVKRVLNEHISLPIHVISSYGEKIQRFKKVKVHSIVVPVDIFQGLGTNISCI